LNQLAYKESKDISIVEEIFKGKVDCKEEIRLCQDCNTPIEEDVEILGCVRRLPIACKCRKVELARIRKKEEFNELQRKIDRFKKYSLMDDRFDSSTFENWVTKEDNKSLYKFGLSYCDKWESMKVKNRGLLLYGKAGNGKTYLSFCIANELYKKGVAVMAISVSKILSQLQEGYRKYDELGEQEIINTIRDASLLILDDLGIENKTHWGYEKLYKIIDTRYRSKKPLIITTNLNLEQLRENLSIVDRKTNYIDTSDRIYNRIIEMCPFIELKGDSWRLDKGRENKEQLLKELEI